MVSVVEEVKVTTTECGNYIAVGPVNLFILTCCFFCAKVGLYVRHCISILIVDRDVLTIGKFGTIPERPVQSSPVRAVQAGWGRPI